MPIREQDIQQRSKDGKTIVLKQGNASGGGKSTCKQYRTFGKTPKHLRKTSKRYRDT